MNKYVAAVRLANLLGAIEDAGHDVSTTPTGNILVGDVLVMAPSDENETWEASAS